MGEISVTKLLVIVILVVLLFGTKKLASLGSDFGAALKGFKKAMNDDNHAENDADFLSEKTTQGNAEDTDAKQKRA